MRWPCKGLSHWLNEALLPEQDDYFCLHRGIFVDDRPDGRQGFLRFGWVDPEPVMACHSDEYQCLIDGQPLRPGITHPLRLGMIIQAGHFLFNVVPVPDGALPLPDEPSLPELDMLLVHGGHYTPWQTPDRQTMAEHLQDDVLKQLGSEYKRYLLWGDQSRTLIARDVQQENRLPERDPYLDNVIESVKHKTMTECIFGEETLIERVLNELMAFNQAEIPDEPRPDILTALAPEHLSRIERRNVSDLLYRELYKMGLDSHL